MAVTEVAELERPFYTPTVDAEVLRQAERANRARTMYDEFDRLCVLYDAEADPTVRAKIEAKIGELRGAILAERLERPLPPSGAQPVRFADAEAGFVGVPFPCHRHSTAILRLDLDRLLNRWEQACWVCSTAWAFERREHVVTWRRLNKLADPEREQTVPLDWWPLAAADDVTLDWMSNLAPGRRRGTHDGSG